MNKHEGRSKVTGQVRAPVLDDVAAAAGPEVLPAEIAQPKRIGWSFYLKLAVSALLIGYILSNANLQAVGQAFANVDPRWLILAFALQIPGTALIAYRWQGLLSAQGVNLPLGYLIRSCWIAGFFRQFLPSTVGGDAIRAYDAWKAGARFSVAVTSLMVDRLFGLIALVSFALIAIGMSDDLGQRIPWLAAWVSLGLLGLTSVLLILFGPARGPVRMVYWAISLMPAAISKKLNTVMEAIAPYRGNIPALLRAFSLSVLLQLILVSFYWSIAMGFGFDINFASFFVIVPLASIVMLAPISINGIGLRESVFIFLLGLWSVGENEALAFAWTEYGIFLCVGLTGGIVYALRRR